MDQGFGIDIDKVLDDFEKNEDNSSHYNPEPIHPTSYWISKKPTVEIPVLQNRSAPFYVSSHSRSDYVSLLNESTEKICLADADFSASSTSLKSSVLVPMIVPTEKPMYDSSSCYNRYVSSQQDKWFLEGVSPVAASNSLISNGFDHEEEEEVLAVQVLTSSDKPTNFEIKLLPGDSALSDDFENEQDSVDCQHTSENHCESQSQPWQELEPTVYDTRQLEVLSEQNTLLSNNNNYLQTVLHESLVLPPNANISDSVSQTAMSDSTVEATSSSSDVIPAGDSSASHAKLEEVFKEIIHSGNMADEIIDLSQTTPTVSVGFDDQVSDTECDDIESYLSNIKISDTNVNEEITLSQPSCMDELIQTDTNESTNMEVLEGKLEKATLNIVGKPTTIPVPNANAYLVNTGARPKVRDPGLVPETVIPKDEVPKDVEGAAESDIHSVGEYSSVLVKTVAKVQEHGFDFNEVSPSRPVSSAGKLETQTDNDVQEETALETESYASSLAGKKQRPTSLNLSGCLSVASASPAAASAPTAAAAADGSTSTQPPPASEENVEKLVDLEVGDATSSLAEDQCVPTSNRIQDIPDFPDLSEEDQMLGKLRPFWIPDVDAPNCMHCDLRFTVLKRRHHCRACGKVLCSQCCNSRSKLPYLENKEARVCHPCLTVLQKVSAVEQLYNPQGFLNPSAPEQLDQDENPAQGGPHHVANSPSPGSSSVSPSPVHHLLGQGNTDLHGGSSWSPNPNNPPEYCSKVPPLQQALSQRPPPTVLVPVGVLKRGDKSASGKREPKQVMFSDGIRPGGDLTDLDVVPEPRLPYRRPARVQRRVDKGSPVAQSSQANAPSSSPTGHKRHPKLNSTRGRLLLRDEAGPLPPLVSSLDYMPEDKLDSPKLLQRLQDETSSPAVFALTKNLSVSIKIMKLDCCMGQEVWCFSSNGMASVGQDEVLFVLQRLPDEDTIPRDAFSLFTAIYDNATKGIWFNELGHLLFPEGLLGAREHAGVLFVRPTHQCQSKLPLPNPPHLVAVLIQKWEVPWAKVFPLRLLLRIGAEYRYYPCPLVSVRFRKPVYGEIGHTIMDVLADFRNYQYTLPVVPGVTVCMEDKKTTVSFPRNRYDQVMKLLNSSNDNVLGLGASFCVNADSHLVCIQNEDGSYQTQAINIQNTPHKVTGASFIVFSGALKSSSGFTGKSSIVEDGLLVQITQDSMCSLKVAIRDMKDFLVSCGQEDSPSTQEQVLLKWTTDDKAFNFGVKSPIDGRSLEGVESIRIQIGTDYATEKLLVRWTEVFFLTNEPASSGRRLDATDPCKLLEALSQACCLALTPCLSTLMESGLTRIGLRVTMNAENVGYEIGSKGEPLEGSHMVDLDSALIPLIMGGGSLEAPLVVELIFHVLHK